MIRKYFSILFLSFIIVGCGGGSTTTPITVELTMESSAEIIQYNDTYTISWTSNASQCYASGAWTGEKPVTGSETFTAKNNGQAGYGMECRKNNIFAQAQAVVTLEKDFVNSFDFKDEDILEILSIISLTVSAFRIGSDLASPCNKEALN